MHSWKVDFLFGGAGNNPDFLYIFIFVYLISEARTDIKKLRFCLTTFFYPKNICLSSTLMKTFFVAFFRLDVPSRPRLEIELGLALCRFITCFRSFFSTGYDQTFTSLVHVLAFICLLFSQPGSLTREFCIRIWIVWIIS